MLRVLIIGALVAATAVVPALAQDAVIEAATAAGTIGEQADGYLGVHGTAAADVRARLEQVNIKRRAAYTDLATRKGVTVTEVAAATACQLLDSVPSGGWYRDGGGSWRQRSGAVVKPGFCG